MQKVEQYIQTLQSHSLATRKAILLGVSFGLTGLLAIIWVVTFSTQGPASSTATGLKEKEAQSPFAILKDNVVEIYANASKGFDSAQK